jgi:uncharacterized repeat protein (TIGR01451 family)
MAGAMALALFATLPLRSVAAQTADVSVTKTGPSQAQGDGVDTVTYLITTTNTGPSTATNVVVSDTLPSLRDFTFLSASRNPKRTGWRLRWPAVTLASGQSIVDTVVIRVEGAGGTVLTNIAAVTANETDPNAANNVSQVQTLIVDPTVISVTVTPDGTDTVPHLPSNGTAYAYAFAVTNTGTVATDFDLLASVSGGSFLTVDSITGAGVTRGAVPDSARLTGVAVGAVASVSVWYRVAGVTAGSLETIGLQARSVPVSTVGDSGGAYVRVVRPAIMTVKSVVPAGTAAPGTDLTYSVLVANGGSEQAAGVTLVDSLPAQVEFKLGSVNSILPVGITAVVQYSTDGSNWTYTPTPLGCGGAAGYDACVRYLRWTLQQPLGATAPSNSATFDYVVRIR